MKLNDISILKNGKKCKYDEDGQIPIYGSNGVIGYTDKSNSRKNSIVIGRVGANAGSVFFSAQDHWVSDNAISVTPDTDKVNPHYLYYVLVKLNLNRLVEGSAQPLLNQSILNSFEIKIPDIQTQNKVVERINVFDKKIVLNKKINDNLVELVDSYFINFLNNVTTVEKTIEDIGTVVGGGTPSKKIAAYWNGDIAWVTPKDLSQHPLIFTSSGENYITGLGLAKGSAKLLPTNTILFSSRAPIGYISIAKNNLATNQGFKSVIPNKEYSFQFIYELLKHETAAIKNEANGSTFKEISGKKLKQHIINIPNSEDTSKFNEITKPIFKQSRNVNLS